MTLLVHILKPYLLVTHINFRFLATWRKHTLYFHEYFKTALKKSVAGYDRWNYTHKKPNKYHYIYMEVNTLWHCILPNTRLLKAWYPVTIYGTLNEAHIQKPQSHSTFEVFFLVQEVGPANTLHFSQSACCWHYGYVHTKVSLWGAQLFATVLSNIFGYKIRECRDPTW